MYEHETVCTGRFQIMDLFVHGTECRTASDANLLHVAAWTGKSLRLHWPAWIAEQRRLHNAA